MNEILNTALAVILFIMLIVLYYRTSALSNDVTAAENKIARQRSVLARCLAALSEQDKALSKCRGSCPGKSASAEVQISALKAHIIEQANIIRDYAIRADGYEKIIGDFKRAVNYYVADSRNSAITIDSLRKEVQRLTAQIDEQSLAISRLHVVIADQNRRINELIRTVI